MNGNTPIFLPEHLRPQQPGRRSRRGLALLSVVPFMLLAAPLWRVDTIRVDGCSNLPQPAVESLQGLAGQPTLGLDVRAIKERVEIWPGVGEVEVNFLLPDTVNVRAKAAPVVGSVQVGRSWHGVETDGGFSGRLQRPVEPFLLRFSDIEGRRAALEAAHRIQKATGARIVEVEHITPTDFRVLLAVEDGVEPTVIHVRPQGTVAEATWCAAFVGNEIDQKWADLRWADRMVVGGGR